VKYAEHPAAPSLADRVECVWFAEDPRARRIADRPGIPPIRPRSDPEDPPAIADRRVLGFF
jgi:hypothetical protein